MFPKKLFSLLALGFLSACAGTQEASLAPEAAISPETEMNACRAIRLKAEEVDFTAPADAPVRVLSHEIIAEFPTTPAEQQKGLQRRFPLHPDAAMLFEFPGDHNPVLWMKDTPASLDMVFFDANGDTFYVEAATTPNSRRFLTPEEPEPLATHVLELPAGRATELGLFPGSSHMTLGPARPCESFRTPA